VRMIQLTVRLIVLSFFQEIYFGVNIVHEFLTFKILFSYVIGCNCFDSKYLRVKL